MRKLPVGCKITNMIRGKRPGYENTIYAHLLDPDDQVIISATLEYIVNQLNQCEFVSVEEYNSL
jgi:hypothetical protein